MQDQGEAEGPGSEEQEQVAHLVDFPLALNPEEAFARAVERNMVSGSLGVPAAAVSVDWPCLQIDQQANSDAEGM